jgi:DNA-3-methyladenine glycosylase I
MKINQELLLDAGIIRNQLKIRGTKPALSLLWKYKRIWCFFPTTFEIYHGKPIEKQTVTTVLPEVLTTPISDAISKDLKKRGFKFVDQRLSTLPPCKPSGMVVNDHVVTCWPKVFV